MSTFHVHTGIANQTRSACNHFAFLICPRLLGAIRQHAETNAVAFTFSEPSDEPFPILAYVLSKALPFASLKLTKVSISVGILVKPNHI
jgi:hypothetical protein